MKMLRELMTHKKYRTYIALIVIIGILLFIAFNIVQSGPYLLGELVQIIFRFLDIISPVFWAFILAYLLYSPMMYIEKGIYKFREPKEIKKKTRGRVRLLSVTITFLLVIILIIGVINFIVPPLITSVNSLLSSIPEFEANLSRWINELTEYITTPTIPIPEETGIVSNIVIIVEKLGKGIIGIGTKWIGSISSFVVDFIVTIILTFYFLKDKEKLFVAIDKFGMITLSDHIRGNLKQFIRDLDDIVGKFIRGTLFASFIVGIISTILMLIIRHPFAILIGVAAGLTNIIPYVGPILGAGLALVLGIFESIKLGLIGAALLLIYQQIDGNVIQPKIVGDQVGLAPVWILIAVLIGGSYFGGIGMILAVPTAALIAVYIERRYQKIKIAKKINKE